MKAALAETESRDLKLTILSSVQGRKQTFPQMTRFGNESGNATPAGKVMLYVKNEPDLW